MGASKVPKEVAGCCNDDADHVGCKTAADHDVNGMLFVHAVCCHGCGCQVGCAKAG